MKLFKIMSFVSVLFASSAFANETMYKDGFISLPEYIQDKVNIEQNEVRLYFDFNCVYCRQLHPYMITWGSSLPLDLTFKFVPIVTQDKTYQLNAAAWQYVSQSKIDSSAKYKYLEHIYTHIRKINDERHLARLIKEAFHDVGLDVEDFSKKHIAGEYEAFLQAQYEEQSNINLEVTPTVLVGGKLLTHLGLAQGELKNFITLLNGVTSYYIYQEREQHDEH